MREEQGAEGISAEFAGLREWLNEPSLHADACPVFYRTVSIGGLKVFYREAGPQEAPTLLLLHGFPSSSRMFETLIPLLADRFHLVAPDYPGFGQSDSPAASSFEYTFDNLAKVVEKFVDALGIKEYALYMQDYGGPVGFRLAMSRPEKVTVLVVQNAVAHEEGLGPLWEDRKKFWQDRAAHEARVIASFTSLEGAKQRHVGTSKDIERFNPDTWTDEFVALSRPGQAQIQSDLFYDYRTNVASYPTWQAWLRKHRPPLLVVWGRHDPSFAVEGATAYLRDQPEAQVHLLEAGHFALDEAHGLIAKLIRNFLHRHRSQIGG